jgi:hypothetical protein
MLTRSKYIECSCGCEALQLHYFPENEELHLNKITLSRSILTRLKQTWNFFWYGESNELVLNREQINELIQYLENEVHIDYSSPKLDDSIGDRT